MQKTAFALRPLHFALSILSLAFCIFLLPSCGHRAQIETLQKETENIHDEAMREMALMNRTGRKLKKQLETVDSVGPRHDAIVDALAQMGHAEDEMMAWMAEYQAPDKLPDAEALRYLQDQKLKILKSHAEIQDALETGKKLEN